MSIIEIFGIIITVILVIIAAVNIKSRGLSIAEAIDTSEDSDGVDVDFI